jgi:hypothetical protein
MYFYSVTIYCEVGTDNTEGLRGFPFLSSTTGAANTEQILQLEEVI